MITENLSTLAIHKLTQAQYERELEAGRIDKNALYLTPDEGVDLSAYATIEQLNGKADKTHNHDSSYDAKGAADTALASAKTYADSAATKVKNDLLNGAGEAYDTLKELGDLIETNVDAIEALEIVAAGKADKTHSHAISDVSGLQSALDGKAASSHGTHVSYSTTDPVMDGVASVGTATTVARSDHKHPTDTSRASQTDLDALAIVVDGKADASHNHNDVYYTESEIDTKIDDLHEELDTVREELDIGKDWNQNDSTKPDFIKNRPFYEHDPVDFKIAEGTIQAGEMLQTAANVESMTLGETYTVIFDGVTYSDLVCVDIGGVAGVGSVDMSLTDYPFAFVVQAGMAMAMVVSDGESHTIAVIGKVSEIVPIERKYIAEHIDMFAGEKATGKVYTIDGVEVTAGKGAEVFNDYSANIASGQYSHAEGMSNTASGMVSHAEGWDTKASGSYSHTEGWETTASGEQSHAEGWLTEATNDAAHAEGFATNATGKYAHAEGDNATASGRAAHAEGYSSEAIGDYSHAEGLSTKASSKNQHVQGKYNIEDANDKYAHIVGNGSSNSSRSNAHTVDWNGNGWFKADVYVGGTSQDDGEKLATKTYVDDTVSQKTQVQIITFGDDD